jgi:alpha-N-arabinofuranosidase
VFLGVRPYDVRGNFSTGRETFMLPVRWKDGWPRILETGQRVPWTVPAPRVSQVRASVPTHGDFTIREEFNGPKLPAGWMMLRNPEGKWWQAENGTLRLDARPVGLGDHGNPSLLARRQQHLNATVTTQVQFNAATDDAEAGIVAFQNDEYWYLLAVGRDHGTPVVRVRRRAGEGETADGVILAQAPGGAGSVLLRIEADGPRYDFAWSRDGRHWRTLLKLADGNVLSTKKAGGFVGAVFGLYAHVGSSR